MPVNLQNEDNHWWRFFGVWTRTDIANYLGLAIETVSRVLGRFYEKDEINIYQQMVKINGMEEFIAVYITGDK